MRVAFVGVKRKYQELGHNYVPNFTRYHLELPWYYARGGNTVEVTTVDYDDPYWTIGFGGKEITGTQGYLREEDFISDKYKTKYDVVVHWRKWFPEFYRPEAINVINCQDHSFSSEWRNTVGQAFVDKKLYGILCFPKWHKENLEVDLKGWCKPWQLIDGLTLGVDTDIYKPADDKDPHQLLWASDPGRGFQQMLPIFLQLYQLDSRFRLNVCWPDYCNFSPPMQHPGIIWHGNVKNGPQLWDLFNRCGVLAYPSTFKEPSSRAHRQAMAAGSLVLYPPAMGTPSDLIVDGTTGIVSDPRTWPATILRLVNTGKWKEIGQAARYYAVSENWDVQAKRFNFYFENALLLRKEHDRYQQP